MAKFNITVELDWMDEGYNLDDEIRDSIISSIVPKVQEKILKQAENECSQKINEQLLDIERIVNQRLNGMMEEFFETPRDVTDKYGDVIKKGVTVKDTLKKACDDFMNQPLDGSGNPAKSSWDTKYNTRVDYLVAKSIDHNMDWAIKKAVDEVTNNIKKKVTDEVKKQMGDKLANILELDKMF